MQRIWQYIFCLLLMGVLGLGIGHYSRDQEVSMLKEWLRAVPAVIEKPVVMLQVVHMPYPISSVKDTKISVDSVPTDTDHMKQIAHVSMPEACLPDVSMSLECMNAYNQDLQHVSKILKAVNHAHKDMRMHARLALAELSIAGPLGRYVESLANALLVRFCKDDGALYHFDYDQTVQRDIESAVALLEQEMAHTEGIEQFKRIEFSPLQRRVQRNAQNEKLRVQIALNKAVPAA